MPSRRSTRTALTFALVSALCGAAASARAQMLPRDNPYAYGLRLALFPATFQVAVSQSQFGSAARAEVDLGRRFVLSVAGRLPWVGVAGVTEPLGFAVRGGLAWNFVDEIESELLANSVYPADTPALGERAGVTYEGTVPVSERLGSPRMEQPDRVDAYAPIRNVQALRLGYDLTRGVQYDPRDGYFQNTVHSFYLGYAHGAHWNLSPATAGEREVGWRRYYFDLMLTAKPLVEAEPLSPAQDPRYQPRHFIGGVRIGMEGAICALLPRAHGLGFGYDLELGLLPGAGGLEGYLFLGFGIALDLSMR